MEHPIITDVIGVAGEYSLARGGSLDPQITRLKITDSNAEGIDIELHGGRYNDRKQKAVINLICDKKMTGNEGQDEEEGKQLLLRRDGDEDDKDGDDQNGGDDGPRFRQDPNSALQFVSYGQVDEGKNRIDVLRLDWRTKYACEDSENSSDDDDDESKSAGWGFFTWFILM